LLFAPATLDCPCVARFNQSSRWTTSSLFFILLPRSSKVFSMSNRFVDVFDLMLPWSLFSLHGGLFPPRAVFIFFLFPRWNPLMVFLRLLSNFAGRNFLFFSPFPVISAYVDTPHVSFFSICRCFPFPPLCQRVGACAFQGAPHAVSVFFDFVLKIGLQFLIFAPSNCFVEHSCFFLRQWGIRTRTWPFVFLATFAPQFFFMDPSCQTSRNIDWEGFNRPPPTPPTPPQPKLNLHVPKFFVLFLSF